MNLVINSIVLVCFLFFAVQRTKRYLVFFQQEEYDGPRFLNWMFKHRVIDKKLSALLIFVSLVALASFEWGKIGALAAIAIAFVVFGLIDRSALALAKKPLAMTQRATRIFRLALVLNIALAAILAFVVGHAAIWLIPLHALPFLLVAANMLLKPHEANVQNKFRTEAEQKLKSISPRIVAITGSFGKTSVKHILGHVLQINSNTLITPGSVNTVMGIVRIIRERLKSDVDNFVVEMGAYGVGSIQRLCDLTPPDFGIITAIGAAHFERFKDLDAVARAKFELAENVIARGGKLVVDERVLAEPYASDFVMKNRDRFIVVGDSADTDIQLVSVVQKAKGIEVTLKTGSKKVKLTAPIFGLVHGRNVALSFAMAQLLDMQNEAIDIALRTVPQITHRLEVTRENNGTILIDDAYNSNPTGFRAALEVLKSLATKTSRKILITPGMVELGEKHDSAHAELGQLAAEIADLIIIVQPERIPTFISAARAAKPDVEILEMQDFSGARQWLDVNVTGKDIVLLENDLPDIYEAVPSL